MKNDRIAMYKFLSIGFTYPEEGFCDILDKSASLIEKSYSALNKNGYRITGIRNFKKSLKELSNKTKNELQGTYTSLFVSNYPSVPLHPYESYYKEGLLVSESSNELNQIYSDCGLETFDNKEFPDLVTFELEFAAFLIEHTEGCLPVFDKFFIGHLFSWIFDFLDDLYRFSETPLFYKSLSSISKSFLLKEKKIIEMDLL